MLSKYIHIILIYLNYLKNSSKLTTKKIYSSDDVFFVYFTCFLEICINLKIKLKKKASVKYIKKSILNTTQKNFFQKHYSFNRYFSDKFQILKNIKKKFLFLNR